MNVDSSSNLNDTNNSIGQLNDTKNSVINSSIGFIIPPQDVQKIIVKTAEWIVKKGESFLEKLKSKKQFPFIESNHFYYEFYRRVLILVENEIRDSGSVQSRIGQEFLDKIMSQNEQDEVSTTQNVVSTISNDKTNVSPDISTKQTNGFQVPVAPPLPNQSTLQNSQQNFNSNISTLTKDNFPTAKENGALNQSVSVDKESLQKIQALAQKDEKVDDASKLLQLFTTQTKKYRSQPTEDPFPKTFMIDIPKDLTEMQLEIIKTTAIYVAKNGIQFLGAISGKHANNPIFEFTKLSHQHFSFFSKLCEIYKKLIRPSDKLRTEILFMAEENNKFEVLQKIYEKAEWDMIQNERIRREKERKKEEQEAMLKVDWQDFIVVETIDFDPEETKNLIVEIDEGFPSLTNQFMEDANTSIFNNEYNSADHSLENNTTEGEKEFIYTSEDNEYSSQLSHPSQITEDRKFVNIGGKTIPLKKYYSRNIDSVEKTSEIKYVKNEDGTLIPISELQQHMKISLIHPQWKEQKKKEQEKFETTNLASNAEIAESLVLLQSHIESHSNNQLENEQDANQTNWKEVTEPPRKRAKGDT